MRKVDEVGRPKMFTADAEETAEKHKDLNITLKGFRDNDDLHHSYCKKVPIVKINCIVSSMLT